MEKYARVNSKTGKGMNSGYIFNDGEYYCETEAEAKEYVESIKDEQGNNLVWEEELKTVDTEEEWFFWTEWHETLDEEDEWYDKQGNLYKNCYRCGKETKVDEEFSFCNHCLTHL